MPFVNKLSKLFVILAMTLTIVSFVDAPAMAQSDKVSKQLKNSEKNVKQLKKDVKRLSKEMRAVQRRVFKGGIPDDLLDAEALARKKSQQDLISKLTVNLARMEREVSMLVGKIEEIEHRQRQAGKVQENFLKDLQMQMSDLQKLVEEKNSVATPSGTTTPAAPATPAPLVAAGGGKSPNPVEKTDEPKKEPSKTPKLSDNTLAEPMLKPVLPEGSVQDKYNYARTLLRRGDYSGAETAFVAFMKAYEDHDLAQNALYWLGETYYARKDFPKALESFFNGYEKYGNGPKGPDSLLKLGLTLANMGEKGEACAAFDELENHYPSLSRNIVRRLGAERGRLGCSG